MAYQSRLELVVDSRTGERSLRSFEGQLNKTERSGQGLISTMGGLKNIIGIAATAAGGLSFGRLISETAGFEDSMLGLQAVSKATAGQMRELEDQARTLGATSMFSAQQAGDAQRFLAQAGFQVNEVLSATPGILQLATAAQMGLAEAADSASNILGGMRLEVDQLSRVNDVLAATAAGSNTSVTQLAQALSTAAPLAAAAGISIEETAAAIGVMSDAGIQAERAGTGLQGVIRQLSNVTPQAATALAGYGLSLEDVNVETHGLSSVLASLQQANISTADAFKIFGSEAGAAAQILVNGNKRVAEFTDSLGDSAGEAERMANVIGSGLTGSMRGFNSMLSESLISLGRDQGVAGGFQAVLDSATGVLAVYNDLLPEFAEANNLSEDQAQNLERLAGVLSTTTTVAGGAAGAYIAYRGAAATATVAQTAFNTAATANPLGLIVTAAGAAAGALYYYREEIGLVDTAAQNATMALDDNADAIRDGSAAALDANYDNLTNALEAVSLQAQEAMAQMTELEARQAFYENSHKGMADSVAGAIDQQTHALSGLWERQVELQNAIQRNREAREGLTNADNDGAEALDTLTVTASRLTGETAKLTKAQKDALARADAFADSLRSLEDRLFPVEAAHRSYRGEQLLLQTALTNGTISIDRYMEAWQRLDEAQLSDQNWQDAYGLDGSGTKELEKMSDAAKDLGLTFESAFENAIVEGENLRGVLDGILQDILRISVRKGVTEPLGTAITAGLGGFMGGFGGGGAAVAGGFMSQLFAEGGYTGSGSKYQPAGVVHAGEFVVQKSVVDKPGVRPALENLNRGYASGGYVGGGSGGSSDSMVSVEIIDQRSGGEKPQVTQSQGPDGRKMIQVLVRDEMKSAFSSGAMDRDMANNYGIKRRGF
tara:strand:+ start:1501 stop:4173 length:2673 start_codon:yes stop_codon:yes gene_type:complete